MEGGGCGAGLGGYGGQAGCTTVRLAFSTIKKLVVGANHPRWAVMPRRRACVVCPGTHAGFRGCQIGRDGQYRCPVRLTLFVVVG